MRGRSRSAREGDWRAAKRLHSRDGVQSFRLRRMEVWEQIPRKYHASVQYYRVLSVALM